MTLTAAHRRILRTMRHGNCVVIGGAAFPRHTMRALHRAGLVKVKGGGEFDSWMSYRKIQISAAGRRAVER